MMSLRGIGYRLFTIFKDRYISDETICDQMNFNTNDLYRLYSGRLMLSPHELQTVSELAGISVDDLLSCNNEDFYAETIHCRGIFSKQSNCDKILDIINSYIDIKESVV